jgi:hypothetical protein
MTPSHLLATDYYLDSMTGNDANSGTTPTQAWATLDKANHAPLVPGDQLLIKAGTTYEGQLTITISGSKDKPITITRYGEGAKPRIDGKGVIPAALYVRNAQYLNINHLQITNTGSEPQINRSGVYVSIEDFGVAHDITLSHLDISNVNGSLKRFDGLNGGIVFYNKGEKIQSCFDGLTIEHCTITNIDRDGIKGRSDYWKRNVWFPSHNVLIQHNQIDNIAGDGIVPYGCDGAIVQYNTVLRARQRTPETAVGIWPWSCDNTLIQYNEVGFVKGNHDGQGYDSDYNCRNSVFQYNYSHDNEGGFILICNGKKTMPENIGNIGTVIRYNISYNDGTPETIDNRGPIFVFSGASANTQIYNNLVYMNKPTPRLMVNVYGSLVIGFPDNVLFANNVFYVGEKAQVTYNLQRMTHANFLNNIYAGKHENTPQDDQALISDQLPSLLKNQTPTFQWLTSKDVTIPADWQKRAIPGLDQPATDFRGIAIDKQQPLNIGPWQ